MSDPTVTVHESLESNRFEARTESDTVAGFARYRLEPDGSYRLLHMEVDDAYEGQGVGSRIAEGVMSSLREQDRRIHPDCPFIASWMRRHPETHDLLADDVELGA